MSHLIGLGLVGLYSGLLLAALYGLSSLIAALSGIVAP